jgi:hypothetical protein
MAVIIWIHILRYLSEDYINIRLEVIAYVILTDSSNII